MWYKWLQPVIGRPSYQPAIDQSDGVMLFARSYAKVGEIMSTVLVPLYAGLASDVTVSLYKAGPTTGYPNQLVYTETFIGINPAEGFYEMNLATPQAFVDSQDFWVGIRTTNDRKTAVCGSESVITTFSTVSPWGGSIVSNIPANTLITTHPAPTTIVEPSTIFGIRDELLGCMWK